MSIFVNMLFYKCIHLRALSTWTITFIKEHKSNKEPSDVGKVVKIQVSGIYLKSKTDGEMVT